MSLFHLIYTVIVQKVKSLIENGEYGRLFAVVHFAGRQWKVTNEDLILIENHIDAACGDRIRMEKVRPRLHVFSSVHTFIHCIHTDLHGFLDSSLYYRCKDHYLSSVGHSLLFRQQPILVDPKNKKTRLGKQA